MAKNQSKGVIQVIDNSVVSINDALSQVNTQLNSMQGLSGNTTVYDRVGVSNPVAPGDAVNLTTLDTKVNTAINAGQMVYGTTYVKYIDSNGQLLHGFGNI